MIEFGAQRADRQPEDARRAALEDRAQVDDVRLELERLGALELVGRHVRASMIAPSRARYAGSAAARPASIPARIYRRAAT